MILPNSKSINALNLSWCKNISHTSIKSPPQYLMREVNELFSPTLHSNPSMFPLKDQTRFPINFHYLDLLPRRSLFQKGIHATSYDA